MAEPSDAAARARSSGPDTFRVGDKVRLVADPGRLVQCWPWSHQLTELLLETDAAATLPAVTAVPSGQVLTLQHRVVHLRPWFPATDRGDWFLAEFTAAQRRWQAAVASTELQASTEVKGAE